ncbi:NAD(P)-dependent dehydrogenase (short-subunit alcohol dehydrogenase family) [Nonomuraea thailandensis]|uniref:NAD(P)-dependent dehydrogenase (Short-subunit alcohol dehydrogenase family) n=1 Tax=Nonomuraea thailandensis TaxID=1188745 RepID=A0A9X2GLU6_9ACTN|nr:SDR family NAD(P)-dependent oxidoreductase [Nonomuraea thailandensis]MCP2360165.1 NAD(P)-dependent dehydrogenase (short-subunit alcohol dehydrogenase family) [Nonomuraea thailandensis]
MEAEQVESCLRLLGLAKRLPADHPDRRRIEHAATGLIRDGRHERRAAARAQATRLDGELLAATAMGAADRRMDVPLPTPAPTAAASTPAPTAAASAPVPTAGPGTNAPAAGFLPGSLRRPRHCYVCQRLFSRVHHFYHRLCPDCAVDNLARRAARTDLAGRRVLLTGGRVKIGHELALMMLRDGAEVMVTTRFPADAARRFGAAPDAGRWWGRLSVATLDLRDPRQVVALTDRLLADGASLDILVNNAAQTLLRPAFSYVLLAAGEASPHDAALPVWRAPGFVPPGTGVLRSALHTAPGADAHEPPHGHARTREHADPHGTLAPTELPGADGPLPDTAGLLPDVAGLLPGKAGLFPDVAGLLPDPSAANSWSARLGGVEPVDLLEAQLVNAVAPFLLADRLLPLMLASPHPRRYVVNVSAVEGQFAAAYKTGGHPHTNMAKAALNMLTRTSAGELAARHVYMCSVDTGWITDEKPLPERDRHARTGWRTPLDVVDGAARVYDPIVRGEAGDPVHGVLLKDYREVPW